ncbi:MAG: hypothetical protein SF123_17295 [Chloroflexota bacterium]|nr:hypothetical protein [Chloroflexota bacterium]
MRSRRNRQFRDLFVDLPIEVKQQAFAAYRLFMIDPRHPSLHFKKLHDKLYSVRVGNNYRALGILYETDLIIWIWIGSHGEYDKLIKQLIGRI